MPKTRLPAQVICVLALLPACNTLWAEETLVLDPIVVTTGALAEDVSDNNFPTNPGHYSVIPRERFADSQTSLAEVIESETGVQVRQSGGLGSYSTVSLRGASEQQVMVFLDGIPLNQSSGGGVDLGRIDLASVEAIEIYRGRTPASLGSASIGGAINIRTRKATGRNNHHALQAGIGSFGSRHLQSQHFLSDEKWQKTLIASYAESANDFEFVNKNRAFDPSDPNREKPEPRQNADSERLSLLGKLGYAHSEYRKVVGSISLFDQKQGLPQRNNSERAQARLNTRDILGQINLIARAYEDEIWDKQLRLFFRDIDEVYDDRASQIGLGTQHTKDNTRTTGLELFSKIHFDNYQLSTSFNTQQEKYNSRDLLNGTDSPEIERISLSAAGDLRIPLAENKLILSPGYRFQIVRDDRAGDSTFRDHYTSPQLGASYQVTQALKIKANAGRYVRIPSFFEQHGDRGFLVGNNSLESEQSDNFDMGIEWSHFPARSQWLNRARLETIFFHNEIKNAIAYVFDAQGVGRAANLGEARIQGLEMTGELGFRTSTSLTANITLQDPENLSDVSAFNGKRLPGRFEESYNLRLEQWLANFKLHYRYHGERGLFYDSANLLPAKDRDEHDIGLTWVWQQWRSTAEIRNLKDKNFQSFNGFPEPGRSLWLNITYKY